MKNLTLKIMLVTIGTVTALPISAYMRAIVRQQAIQFSATMA